MTGLGIAPALGVDCFTGDLDVASVAVVQRAMSGAGGYACLANVHSLVSAVHEPGLRRALDEAWAVFPDGSPVAWLQRHGGAHNAARIAGTDLMTRVLGRGQSVGLRHFFYGSTEATLERLTARLREQFPDAAICGSYAPPYMSFDAPEAARGLEAIEAAQPHVMWCGLGMPKQELWMQHHARRLGPTLTIGVGAAFDFLAGTKRRAPVTMQRTGLEWLHRLASEPRRLSGRYLQTNSEFVALLGWELLRHRRST